MLRKTNEKEESLKKQLVIRGKACNIKRENFEDNNRFLNKHNVFKETSYSSLKYRKIKQRSAVAYICDPGYSRS